jgi:Ca2+-transporting ATPase
MPKTNFNIQGLSIDQVQHARDIYGANKLTYKKENTLLVTIKRLLTEPMMILLLGAAMIYFISGKIGDGIFMGVAIIFQAFISLYQYTRSKNALEKLKDFAQPNCKVIRQGEITSIKSEEIVIGDSLLVEEGALIAADGQIVYANDFSVNESILTGESLSVLKEVSSENNTVFSGTMVSKGMAIATVTAIGNQTKLGKIGVSLESVQEEKTPLEVQIANFVKKMAFTGALVFLIVWSFNYWNSRDILSSLLKSLTLAMSILPEEIPVAFTTFMALGAWRLMKLGILVKQMKTVETLGSATVICTDKTGTLTENKMDLAQLYTLTSNKIVDPKDTLNPEEKELVLWSILASEPNPFDPMEMALHATYNKLFPNAHPKDFRLVHDFPLEGNPPMMTHIYEDNNGKRFIAAKGAPEALIEVSELTPLEKEQLNNTLKTLSSNGYRLLGVGSSSYSGLSFPKRQQELSFTFKGIIAFYDPPKKDIQNVIESFYTAGISVKIITGDSTATTSAIAKQIGIRDNEKNITGEALMKMDHESLKTCVMETTLFTRMFPEAKLKIINALKENQQVVAMTGDGVNDGPALKAAHIGIAMGKKGSEIAKQAASLILLEDDLSKMVDAIAMGRKIYTNLKKAIQYIISIHIPIILTVFIPLALGWKFPNIFSPIHIIFLEIIMGPTCSILYENEPMEKNTMQLAPRKLSTTFFNWSELSISIVQGLTITAGTLSVYLYAIENGFDEAITRTMVFTVLIFANIFLTLINRSFYYSIWTTLKYKNVLVPYILLITVAIMALLLFFPPFTRFFEFKVVSTAQISLSAGVGFITVIWFEIFKWFKRNR